MKDMGVSLSLKGDGQPGCQGTRMVQIITRPACTERIANQLKVSATAACHGKLHHYGISSDI
jgi:hypothetical protein